MLTSLYISTFLQPIVKDYCEGCGITFTEGLVAHRQSEIHRAYVGRVSNWNEQ